MATTSAAIGTRELVYDEVEHLSPIEILNELAALEDEISNGVDDLKALLT